MRKSDLTAILFGGLVAGTIDTGAAALIITFFARQPASDAKQA